MTPERKDEIKWDYENTKSAIRNHIVPGHIKRIVVNTGELLSALEEAQQTIARLESELEEMTHDRNIWRSNSTEWEGQEELEEEEGETQP